MAQLRLTAQHKEMLTSLAEALRQGTVGVEWILSSAAGGIGIICFDKHVDSPKLLRGWSDVKHADFNKFADLGLFRLKRHDEHGFPDYYILDEAEILHLVDNNFEEPTSTPGSVVYITSPNSIVNVQSVLNNSNQIIHNSPSLQEDDKQTFEKLINDLKSALADVPSEQADDVETIAISANRLTEDVSSPKPNKRTMQISADGLKKAAENIAAIAPPVMAAVQAILAFVSQIHH